MWRTRNEHCAWPTFRLDSVGLGWVGSGPISNFFADGVRSYQILGQDSIYKILDTNKTICSFDVFSCD